MTTTNYVVNYNHKSDKQHINEIKIAMMHIRRKRSMKKKQYRRRMMETFRRLSKETGQKIHNTDRINTPKWGSVIRVNCSHKGEILTSYAQAWDIVNEIVNK